jgi:hypothetical protein
MRRALVLTTEAARHPFRMSLPPHVFRLEGDETGESAKKPDDDDNDWKLFCLSFLAFFTVAYSFIA